MRKKQKNLLIGIILILILIFLILFVEFFSEKGNIEESEKNFCSEESRNVEVCITLYEPVCGYYSLDCDDVACKQTFSNSCFACIDESVLFYIKGEC